MQIKQDSLAGALTAFRQSFLDRLPHGERANLEAAEATTRLALQSLATLQMGQTAPDFTLYDQHGRAVRLAESLARGPVVLLFVRGAWCPFCTMTLRAYQDWLPAFHDAGAELLAITPQPASTCSIMAERDLLAFQTLSDPHNAVARAYGIAVEVAANVRPMMLRLGHDLPRLNGTGDWMVPLPATFVIGQDGRAKLAHVEPVYHRRLDPARAAAALTEAVAA